VNVSDDNFIEISKSGLKSGNARVTKK